MTCTADRLKPPDRRRWPRVRNTALVGMKNTSHEKAYSPGRVPGVAPRTKRKEKTPLDKGGVEEFTKGLNMSIQSIDEYMDESSPVISPELRKEIEHIATLPGFTAVSEEEIYRCATRFDEESFVRGAIIDSMWKSARPTRRKKPIGFVYFIEAPETGRLKIGHSGSPKYRMESIQSMSPVKLRMIGVIPGSIADEKALHARFSAYRTHGEWFEYSRQIRDYIQGVCQ